jgi:hypothetical protein
MRNERDRNMTGVAMHENEVERMTRLQDLARSHATRANILALVAEDQGRSLDPDDLSRELPNETAAAVVRYHLKMLRTASLLPSQAAGETGGSTPSAPPD